MKSNNKLNKAFKDALDGHPEPLREAQWEKLRAELDEKRRKRPFPWIFILAGLLLVGVAGAYFIGFKSNVANDKQFSDSKEFNSRNSSPETPKIEESTNSNAENSNQNDPEMNSQDNDADSRMKSIEAKKFSRINEDKHNSLSSTDGIKGGRTLNSEDRDAISTGSDVLSDITKPEKEMENDDFPDKFKNKGNESKDIVITPPIEPLKSDVTVLDESDKDTVENKIDLAKLDDEDTLKKNKGKKVGNEGPDGNGNGKFVFGLCSGLTMVTTKVVGFTNEEKMHKETRSVFENTFERQQSRFFNFSFEWYFSKRIGLKLNSGLQYRTVNTNVDFNYKLKEAPFRDADGKIITYITLPDSSAFNFRLHDKIGYKMVTLPIQLGYLVPITKKSEIMISGGITLSALVGSSGNALSIDELAVKPAEDMLTKKFNIGFAGGLMYSYNIYNRWWLGLETQMQSSRMDYDMLYGVLKSRINVNSFNLNLRYKL